MNRPLSDENWIRQFISSEKQYLWQLPEMERKVPTNNHDWWRRSAAQLYIEEMSVCAHWMSGNSLCNASLGQQCIFPCTDFREVRSHRHVAAIRDNKQNQSRFNGTPATYHTLVPDAGVRDGARAPDFIKPLFKDDIINGRVSSITMILTIMQLGGYTGENICHPNSWATQILARHVRRLGQLEDEENPTDFSGDGQISRSKSNKIWLNRIRAWNNSAR